LVLDLLASFGSGVSSSAIDLGDINAFEVDELAKSI
jgi:hypothetical protein